MPHSSGGGSHSGGSHGGGSHGGGGGGSGRGAPRVSNRPYPNSRRYMYYDRHGAERFIYSTSMPARSSLASLVITLIFMVPFVLAGLTVTRSALTGLLPKKPLTPFYEENAIHISDTANVIDNEAQLEVTLNKFEDTTGICPYIVTIYNSDWQDNYETLESYAYDYYVNSFNDEQHFLIVYSEPENAKELDFNDWYYEGMQGDTTDRILTETCFTKFQEDLQMYLTKDTFSVGEAFYVSFSNSLGYIMGGGLNEESSYLVIFALVWDIFVSFFIITTIRGYINGNRDYKEVPMEQSTINLPNSFNQQQNYDSYSESKTTYADKDPWDL